MGMLGCLMGGNGIKGEWCFGGLCGVGVFGDRWMWGRLGGVEVGGNRGEGMGCRSWW